VSLSQYAVQVSSNMMVGHLPGVLPLSSAAIATSLASVSGFSLLVRTLAYPHRSSFRSFSFFCAYSAFCLRFLVVFCLVYKQRLALISFLSVACRGIPRLWSPSPSSIRPL
jgi:hypothetical protein